MENRDPSIHSLLFNERLRQSTTRRVHTFVLRMVVESHGGLRGTISEPGSDDDWHPGFAKLEQLPTILDERIQQTSSGAPEQ